VNIPPNNTAYHVEMPLLPAEAMIRMGPQTPLGTLTPQRMPSPAPPSFASAGSRYGGHGLHFGSEFRNRPFDDGDGDDERDTSRVREVHTRRHTLESGMDYYSPMGIVGSSEAGPSTRPPDAPRTRRSFFPSHNLLLPSIFGGSSRTSRSRSRDEMVIHEDSSTLLGSAGDLMSSYLDPRGGALGVPEPPRARSRPRMNTVDGARLPSWGAHNQQDEARPRASDEERRAIMRAMLDNEMMQQQMEGVEDNHMFVLQSTIGQPDATDDNHQFVQQSQSGGGAVAGHAALFAQLPQRGTGPIPPPAPPSEDRDMMQ
jgi:hypothetical protein